MNLRRLLQLAIILPSLFVVIVSAATFIPHWRGLLSHEVEHIVLALGILAGIIPFSFLMLRIFRRIEQHILRQNETLSQRNKETEALLKVGKAAQESLKIDTVLPAALRATLEATSADAAEVWLSDHDGQTLQLRYHEGGSREAFVEISQFRFGEGYPGMVALTGKAILVHDLPNDKAFLRQRVKDEGFHAYYAMPLRSTTGIIGVLAVASKDSKALRDDAELRLLELMAERVAGAVENATLHEEVQTLAILTERERLAREMHDGIAQVLGYVNTKVQAVKELLKTRQTDTAVRQMDQLERAAQETYDDVREAVLALGSETRKGAFVDSLKDYLVRFGEMTNLAAELSVDGQVHVLNPRVEVQLIRIVQESLANVRKHAQASRARVSLSFQASGFRLTIEDDGHGFDPTHLERGPWPRLGLRSMQERAAAIDGRFTLDTAPGRGTRVMVDLPATALRVA